MRVKFRASFKKDLKHIKDQKLLAKMNAVIDEVKGSGSLAEVSNLTKLKGYEDLYRIRIGNFRVGVRLTENEVVFVRFLHRKEIYRFFP